ncbi:hypothetical protein R1sor_020840 [Riccia sorocarpa]|uniref:Reverse transcriptase domain-containing protein n=1 Tax=Riccia sorocarpa TaxID=122646 RepID=A0ABD3GL05_9MARC
MQFAAAGGLTIINGTAPFPDTQSVTCRTHNGSSTMDFLLACKSALDRILDFSFGPFSPELDHRPLRCTLMGFEREIRRQYRRSKVGVCLDVTKRHQYETTLMNKLNGRELTSGTLANIITGVAKEVFTAKQPRDKGWFDEDCRVARSKAMSAVDQRTAFRQYNNFIRARKRRFICQHQRVLVGELMKCPKTFWQRFRSRIILPELKAEDLYKLRSLQVPAELLAAVTVLYEKVLVKIKADDPGIESTLGVIQGCPLSPTLFGLLIDTLYEHVREHEEGFVLGTQSVSILLFADDVVLIANSESQLHRLVRRLETFCHQFEMSVNLSKTKWLRRGPGLAEPVMSKGNPLQSARSISTWDWSLHLTWHGLNV